MTPDFSQTLEALGAAFLSGFTGIALVFVIILIAGLFINDEH
jgi:hypothetical protein